MRKLYAKVNDREMKWQSQFAGVQGEAGATALVLSFTPDWAELGKHILFYNSHHEAPVEVLLGVDRQYGDDIHSYLVPLPAEFLAYAGDGQILIEGTEAGTRKLVKTLCATLRVHPAPTGTATTMAEDEVLQLQAEIDSIKETLLEGLCDAEQIGAYAQRAETAAHAAEQHANIAKAAARNCQLMTGDCHAACYQGTITVPTRWVTADGGMYVDAVVAAALSTDALWMFVPQEKKAIAEDMGLFACESMDGYVRLWAHKEPKESFCMDYTLVRGVIAI